MPPKEKKAKSPEEGGGGELQPPSPTDGASSAWDKAKADPKPYKPPVGQKIPNFTPERPKAVPLPKFTPGQNLEFTDVLNRGAGPEGGGGGSMDQLYTGEELPSGPSQGMPEVYPNAEQRNAYAADVPDPSLPAPPRRPIVGPEESRRIFQSHSAEGQALADLSDMYKAKIAEATAPAITPGPTEPTESVKGQLQSAQAGAYHGRKVVHGVPEAARDYSQEEMDQLLLTDPRAHAQIMASHHDNLVKKIVANEQEAARARLEAKGIVVPSTPQGGQAHETQVAAPTHVAQAASSHPGGGSPSATPSHAPAARPSGDFVGPKAPVSEARKVDTSGVGKAIVGATPSVQSATPEPTPAHPQGGLRAGSPSFGQELAGSVSKVPYDLYSQAASGMGIDPSTGYATRALLGPVVGGAKDLIEAAPAVMQKGRDIAKDPLGEASKFAHGVAQHGATHAVNAALGGGILKREFPNVTEGMGNWSAEAPKEAYPVGEVPYAPRTAPPFVEDLGSKGPSAKAAPKASAAEAPPSAPRPNPGAEAVAKAGGGQKVLDFAHGQQAQKEASGMAKAMSEKPKASAPEALKGKDSPKALPPGKESPSKGKATPMGGDAPSGAARPAGPAGSSKPKPEISGSAVGQKALSDRNLRFKKPERVVPAGTPQEEFARPPATVSKVENRFKDGLDAAMDGQTAMNARKVKAMSTNSKPSPPEGRPQGPVQTPTKMTVTETPKKSWIDRFKNRGK